MSLQIHCRVDKFIGDAFWVGFAGLLCNLLIVFQLMDDYWDRFAKFSFNDTIFMEFLRHKDKLFNELLCDQRAGSKIKAVAVILPLDIYVAVLFDPAFNQCLRFIISKATVIRFILKLKCVIPFCLSFIRSFLNGCLPM